MPKSDYEIQIAIGVYSGMFKELPVAALKEVIGEDGRIAALQAAHDLWHEVNATVCLGMAPDVRCVFWTEDEH